MKKINIALGLILAAVLAFDWLGDDSFNCHNYAWETERRWLDDPSAHITAATECAREMATRIVYFADERPIHSGVYLGDGWVRSKWGSNPIITHPVYVSAYGFDVKYYR